MSNLTKEQILSMPAGREMDAKIGRDVMGLDVRVSQSWQGDLTALGVPGQKVKFMGEFTAEREWVEEGDYFYVDGDGESHVLPNYSTDIAAAWQVVEKMQSEPLEYYFEINKTPSIPYSKTGKSHWHCELGGAFVFDESAPLAICRAALLATMESDK